MPVSIIKLFSVVSSNPDLQITEPDEKFILGPFGLFKVWAILLDELIMIGAEAVIFVKPLLGEISFVLNKSCAMTLFAVNVPTKVAFPDVVSPSADAVITSDCKSSTISLVLSSHV